MLGFGYWFASLYRVLPEEIVSPQIRPHADEQAAVNIGSSHLPVRETLLSGCLKTRTSRCWFELIRTSRRLFELSWLRVNTSLDVFLNTSMYIKRYFLMTRSGITELGCINRRNNRMCRSAASPLHDHAFEPGKLFVRKARCSLFKLVQGTLDPLLRHFSWHRDCLL